jgi:hypothetical protein
MCLWLSLLVLAQNLTEDQTVYFPACEPAESINSAVLAEQLGAL